MHYQKPIRGVKRIIMSLCNTRECIIHLDREYICIIETYGVISNVPVISARYSIYTCCDINQI